MVIFWRTKNGQPIPVHGRSEMKRILQDEKLGAKYWCGKCKVMVSPSMWETHKFTEHSGREPDMMRFEHVE